MRTFIIVFLVLLWIGSIILINSVSKGGGFFTKLGKKASVRANDFRSEFAQAFGVKQQIFPGAFSFDSENPQIINSSFDDPLITKDRVLKISLSNSPKALVSLKESSALTYYSDRRMHGEDSYPAVLLIPTAGDRNLLPMIRDKKLEVGAELNPASLLKKSFDYYLKDDKDVKSVCLIVLRLQPNGSELFIGADWVVVDKTSGDNWTIRTMASEMCLTEYSEIELKSIGRSSLKSKALLYGGYVADIITAPIQGFLLFVFLAFAAIFGVCK